MLAGPQGSVVWERPSTAFTTPRGAARATTVIYRSRSMTGAPIFVSGDVLEPAGTPPRDGWPVVAYTHVTTGGADRCAPTRASEAETDDGRMLRSADIASDYLSQGLAVVRTDYEGLGTPGRHPYLIGRSLARANLDMVRAGRDLSPNLSSRFVAAGHSEGGVAALFTGAYAATMAPELQLEGISALAPVIAMKPLFEQVRKVPVPLGSLTNLAALVIDGAGVADPTLDAMYPAGGLSSRAWGLYPHIQQRCLGALARLDSWGGLAPANVLGQNGSAAYARFQRVLDDNDVTKLEFPAGVPMRLDQGGLDPITFKPFADRFAALLRSRGHRLDYRVYPSASHTDLADQRFAATPAADWATNLLRR